ncbi:hypothetical protein MauCBS54593_005707 [Microsporum audouinii]
MPAIIPKQSKSKPSLTARRSPTDWDSWTPSQQGGVLAASLLVFLFFFGLGVYLWQRHRERKQRERRPSRSRGRARHHHTKKRPISHIMSPPRKKPRIERVMSRAKAETPDQMMQGALATPESTTKEQPTENNDTPGRVEEADQEKNKPADATLDQANDRLKRRRERRREARRRPTQGYTSAARRAIKGYLDESAAVSRTKEEPTS